MKYLRSRFRTNAYKDVGSVLKKIGICGMVFMAMVVYFFTGLLNSYVLFALPFCSIFLVFVLGRFLSTNKHGKVSIDLKSGFCIENRLSAYHIWLLALFGVVWGFVRGSWRIGNLIDLVIIFCCVYVILGAPDEQDIFRLSLKILAGFALFYAAGIWVQMLLPNVYALYVDALKNGSDVRIQTLTSYYTGFSTSPGHTATFITVGMFAFLSGILKNKWVVAAIEGFLFVSLLCTGMRMPVLALCAGMFCYACMRIPKEKRKFLYIGLPVVTVAGVLLSLLFMDQLRAIPTLNRVFITIEAAMAGKDITSGRSVLYRHAWNLFLQHPILGIGWGNFRYTVAGVVTENALFDVHNVYLQLLCECGIPGFLCLVIPMVYTFIRTVKALGQTAISRVDASWKALLGFSFLFQAYFLLFSMTDNLLFYTAQQILYLFSCAILFAYIKQKGRTNATGRIRRENVK